MNRIERLFEVWLDFKFQLMEFEILFPENKDIIELREETIPDFFDDINYLYWYYFFMTVSRLLDNNVQGKNLNLTLYTLPALLEEKGNVNCNTIKDRVDKLKIKFDNVRLYRKKHLAHFDLDYTIGNSEFNSTTNIDDIKYFLNEMLELITNTQKELSLPVSNPTIIYRGKYKGANELLRILRDEKTKSLLTHKPTET